MMSRKTLFATLLLASTGLGLAACEMKSATAPAGSAVNSSDTGFVTTAYNVIEFDEQEASYTALNAKDPRVKALASQFLQQARDFRSNLKPVADSLGIMPPTVLREDLRARLAQLKFNNGVGVDKAFIEDQIASHTDALNAQMAMMNTPGENAQITKFSMRGTVILKENLAKLRTLQRTMMMEGV